MKKIKRKSEKRRSASFTVIVVIVGIIWCWLSLLSSMAEGKPKIVFENDRYNGGVVPVGTIISHDFVFSNQGDSPLIIKDPTQVKTLEGC